MESENEKKLDAYIKKTIKNTIIDFAKSELNKRQREVSYQEVENFLIEYPLSFSEFKEEKLEDYFLNEKLVKIIASLSEEKKQIIRLSVLENYNSKEIRTNAT